ncbi:lysophospholipid acyltransferase family protein [Kiloniella laminariae]|uniref:lysophospholipid acyltransferase family protein n=1 Tax=Kiloniella laminariae TaxID=454162 RepID=UPI00036EFCDC|nr:lysophospholipid acyltransferase family protein [Kiloniella laminariae]
MSDIAVASGLGSGFRATRRLFAYVVFTFSLIPLQALLLLLRLPGRYKLPLWYHKASCHLTGVQVIVHGKRSTRRPTLFVSNHVSYLDISVLGSLIDGHFVAKSEVSGWPLFGLLAKLSGTVFIQRRRHKAGENRDDMLRKLGEGRDLILFPEGTSSDGQRVLPFKSALFSVAQILGDDRPLLVQPISITYTRLDGMPMGRLWRPFYAWYGDMELPGHLWHALAMGTLTVEVEFLEPVEVSAFANRKDLAVHCHAAVSRGVSSALTGQRLRIASDPNKW